MLSDAQMPALRESLPRDEQQRHAICDISPLRHERISARCDIFASLIFPLRICERSCYASLIIAPASDAQQSAAVPCVR